MIPCIAQLPDTLSWSEKLAYLTARFLSVEQTDCPLEHKFEEGRYIREIKIPAGTLFIGRVHRHGHECTLDEGTVVHITEHGSQKIEAPHSVHTTPGYQMVIYAVTDVVGRSIHPNPTDSRDVQALEDDAFESVQSLKDRGLEVQKRLQWQA